MASGDLLVLPWSLLVPVLVTEVWLVRDLDPPVIERYSLVAVAVATVLVEVETLLRPPTIKVSVLVAEV